MGDCTSGSCTRRRFCKARASSVLPRGVIRYERQGKGGDRHRRRERYRPRNRGSLVPRRCLCLVVGRNDANGAETVASIETAGGKAAWLHADVASPSGIDAMLAFAVTTYGVLDILCN